MKIEAFDSSAPRWMAWLVAAGMFLGGCSSGGSVNAPASAAPGDVKLTAAQMQHVQLYTVAEAQFHKATRANGTVDFDQERSTSVLAPISGPVTKLLVAPGDRVKKG
ncbi:MAG TPA: efflux RND transporter periplasmic adaptor subunit, partial [Rudaea sp.]|nr:efflux RND transporter periplasmic adaptor subunit [Rudaea sp.]